MRVLASRLVLVLLLAGTAAACDDYLIGENLDAEPAPPALFAVAYLDREDVREDDVAWRINPAIGLVINTSPAGDGIDLRELRVVSVDDDSPRVELSFSIEGPAAYTLPVDRAGGRLASGLKWIGPLVPEPRHDDRGPALQYRLDYLEPAPHRFDATVHATVVLELAGHRATLPFEIRIRSTGALGGQTIGARRVRSVGPGG